jgi:hypothetical protein
LTGAILKLYPEMKKRVAVWRKLEIKLDQDEGRYDLELWNDKRGRTWAHVAALLKKARL